MRRLGAKHRLATWAEGRQQCEQRRTASHAASRPLWRSVGRDARSLSAPAATAPLGKLGKQGRRGRLNLLTGLTASSARRADIHAPMVSFGRTLFVAMSYACPRWRLARAPSLQKRRAAPVPWRTLSPSTRTSAPLMRVGWLLVRGMAGCCRFCGCTCAATIFSSTIFCWAPCLSFGHAVPRF